MDATFFTHPKTDWQRRYEALRAAYVDRLSAKAIAQRFGYKSSYVYLLRHLFKKGKLDFSEPVVQEDSGKTIRRRVSREVREKICSWRKSDLSAGDITQLLSEENVEISVRTVERVLAEEGFTKLPRRTRLKTGVTVKGTAIPERSKTVEIAALDGQRFESDCAGIFLFAPFLAQFDIPAVVRSAGLPGSKSIPAINYLLSFLALKLAGDERYAHVGEHGFDLGLGLFVGLNVLPKCTSMSTYSFGLDQAHINKLQAAFVIQAKKLGLYGGTTINLDFHTVPHFGEESVLEKNWAGARNKVVKGALTMFAQDAESKLLLYSGADIKKSEADDQVLEFLSYLRKVREEISPTFVFDSKFTTYRNLYELDKANVKFITLRRRGPKMVADIEKLKDWKRIHIPHVKRKFPNPLVHVSNIELEGYNGELRQVIIRGNGREKPTFLVTNDFKREIPLIVGDYSRRWRVENGIAEAVKFFNLNAISSPILTKVHFDVALTMIADTLYDMLARRLRGFEKCNASKIYRNFIRGKTIVEIRGSEVSVTFPKRAHNPILRGVAWDNLPSNLVEPRGAKLRFNFM